MLFERRIKCMKCGTIMKEDSYRCPGCGVIITSIDGESVNTYQRRKDEIYRKTFMQFVGIPFFICLAVLIFFMIVSMFV